MSLIDFKERYSKQRQDLTGILEVDNVNALPKLAKISVNVGTGRLRGNKDMLAYVEGALKQITGQKPAITKARKSIAGFKLREGEEVGMRVTLRGGKMYDFLNRLINVTLPRIREFRGFAASSFDAQGNLNIGLGDTSPFAELGHSALDKPFGMSITLNFRNSSREKSFKLLQTLGLPVKID
ncbi:MAG: 50S ribosomal protein L5 [Candidatus Berkelbacteria bacterium]|nr:MAG: 50S ribosomal protein L5 [Candidatus Berkelbacteria bacterium]QQG52104.1 MAG: 50S ribosomal protein L5 [Candidatus Berkelbacteria bacterium]